MAPEVDELASNGDAMIAEPAATWSDPAQDAARARVHEALFGDDPQAPPPEPRCVGRYQLLAKIGEGAMGEVFRARDPLLERNVAIKTLRAHLVVDRGRGASRLIQEARSMARLDHPHVVRVFEAGLEGTHAWIAMEYVEGANLREWLGQRRRGLSEIIACLVDAGRGLAAAHTAGLVHRDFKPDNVLIDRNDRARVGDFGLVRALVDERVPSQPASDADVGQPFVAGRSTTRDGVIVGTPAYMPPEQLAGDPVDPTGDQFAFCVTGWEALFGVRPFAGHDPLELCASILAGNLRRPRNGLRVPGRVERALRRGLSPKAGDRFAAMEDLLAQLVPGRRTKMMATTAAVALAGGAAVWATNQQAPACTYAEAEAMLVGIWDGAAVARTDGAIRGSGLPYSDATADAVRDEMDHRMQQWVEAWQRACTSSRMRVESTARIERRVACLRSRLADSAAMVRRLGDADARAVVHARDALKGLPTIGECERLDDDGPATAPEVAQSIDSALAAGRSLRLSGHPAAGLALLEIAGIEASRGSAPGQASDAALEAGAAMRALGDVMGAIAGFHRAIDHATEAADEARAARAWFALAQISANDQRDLAAAEQSLAHAEALGRRVDDSGALERRAAFTRAEVMALRSPAEALVAFQSFVEAIRLRAPGDEEAERLADDAVSHRGPLLLDLGEWPAAAEEYRHRIARARQRYGDGHPRVADAWLGLGIALDRDGQVDGEQGAEAAYRRAQTIWWAAWPGGHRDLGAVTIALANLAQRRGDLTAAAAHADEVMRIYRSSLTTDRAVEFGETWTLKGVIEHRRGKFDDAARCHDEARRVYETTSGEHSANAAIARSNAAEARLAALGDHGSVAALRELRSEFDRAREDLLAAVGAEHPYLAFADKGLGSIALALGEREEAHRRLTAALGLCAVDETDCAAVRRLLDSMRVRE